MVLDNKIDGPHEPRANSINRNALKIEVKPIAGALGAEIFGPDLTRPMSDSEFGDIHQAFLDYLVVFIRQKKPLTAEQQTAFAARFGEVDFEPFSYPFKLPTVAGHSQILLSIKEAGDPSFNVGGFWHADVTYRERPHKAAVIYARDVPSHGGDTMFANQYLAYETLSDGMQAMLSPLRAVHGNDMRYGGESARFGSVSRTMGPKARAEAGSDRFHVNAQANASIENEHPVVRTHPETLRKSLYVNRGFTSRFSGMTEQESRPLLEYLWEHASRAELTCRYRWMPHDVGIWDNRCLLHYAVNDYSGQRREMWRISVHEPARPA
jgi:taurine dioxygenase